MSAYRPYPKYKPSGVEWLGDVPDGWRTVPVFAHFRRVKETNHPDLQLLSVYRDYGVIPKASRDDNFNKASEDLGAYQRIQQGDLVLNKMKAWQGSIGVSSHEGIVSPAYFTYRPTKSSTAFESNYLHHLVRSLEYIAFYLSRSKGIRVNQWDLDPDEFRSTPLICPPLPEQHQIASFLDRECGKLDALQAKQERLIELLKEKRQALISHAVTRGLDPTAKLKPSGIEWLGEVPEHWRVCRVKHVAKLESGHTPSKTMPGYWEDCNIPWVSLNDTKQLKDVDYITDTALQISELGMKNSSAHLLPERAVIFTRDATIGLAAITTRPMAVSQHIIAWICKERFVIPEYLLLVFYGMASDLERFTAGATLKTIGMPDVNKLSAAIPPLIEQREIVDRVYRKMRSIDAAKAKAERGIELLKERRSALISATVTGKIDVRKGKDP